MKLKVLGLTGTIGSGKSEAARILAELGATIIDADLLSREAVIAGSECLAKIVKEFGAEYLTQAGELDRGKLAKLVFSDSTKLKILEAIVHPEVRRLSLERLGQAQSGNSKLIVYVVPLLFESGLDYSFIDKIAVVSAPKYLCIERIIKRDSCDRDLATKKIEAQIPIEEKENLADYVIRNDGDLKALRNEVKRVWHTLTSPPV